MFKKQFILMKLALMNLTLLLVLLSCQDKEKKTLQKNSNYSFYIGTYTKGDSDGIYSYTLSKDGKLIAGGLAARTENPSYLAKNSNGKFLVAVNEVNNKDTVGTLSSFIIEKDSLIAVNSNSSGGADPCFVMINDEDFVLTANYSSGNVGLLKLNSSGKLSRLLDVQQHTGKGTTSRQKGPHAHSAWFAPDHNTIISIDLGTNQLWFYHLDTIAQKLVPTNQKTLNMKNGAGPRHLTFHPNGKWIYVINELNSTITLVKRDANNVYEKINSISTLPDGYIEPNTSADIHISSDGKFVYASNRGHNSIAIFEVDPLDGSLQFLAHESTRGDGPRNFALSPDENYLLVANQLTNTIVSFKRDKANGLLKYIDQVTAPSPVCILF